MSTPDEQLWDLADHLLDLLNIEDLNPPGLIELIADTIRPWLAAHDREVAARAWDKGYNIGARDYAASITAGASISTPNPYREGS